MTTGTKVCRGCKEKKSLKYFYSNGQGYGSTRCKECHKKYQRDKHKADPNIKKNFHLKYNYGITLEKYKEMFAEQGGRCAICESDSPGGKGNYFHVDHNHETGEVRGLLCHHCNIFLGCAFDSVLILKAAIKYLEKWS